MNGWKSTIVFAGGLGLVAAILIAGPILLGHADDPKGGWLAALIIGYWLAVLAVGAVVVRGLLYFFRRLDRRKALFVALGAFLAIPVAIVLHNVIYGITGQEEGFFFMIALFIAPVLLITALVRAIMAGPRGRTPTIHGGSGATGH